MECPKCGDTNRVFFDGSWFKCFGCSFIELVKNNYNSLVKKWQVGG